MKISLSPVKQVAIGYYYQGIEDYINLESVTLEQLAREIKSSIDDYAKIPGDSKTRIIARAIRPLSQVERAGLTSELVKLLYDISSQDGNGTLLSLIEEASNALQSACPKELKLRSDIREFDGKAINTFEFLQLLADSGVKDILTLQYAIPEAIAERIDRLPNDMGELFYRGLNSKKRTPLQEELMKNPDLFCAATKGLLELEGADQLIDFAHTVFVLKYSVIKRQWDEKDNKAKEIMTNAIRRAAQIAEYKLKGEQSFDESTESTTTDTSTDSASIREFMRYAMIHMENFPLREIPLSRKIDFANSFQTNLFLIANSLPNIDLTREQISVSLKEMTYSFDLPETTGVYSWTKDIFEMFDTHAFVLRSSTLISV